MIKKTRGQEKYVCFSCKYIIDLIFIKRLITPFLNSTLLFHLFHGLLTFYLTDTHFMPPFRSHLLTFSTLFAHISCPPSLPTYSHFLPYLYTFPAPVPIPPTHFLYLICTHFLPNLLDFPKHISGTIMSGSSERPKLYLLCVNSSTFCPSPVFTFPSVFRFINN